MEERLRGVWRGDLGCTVVLRDNGKSWLKYPQERIWRKAWDPIRLGPASSLSKGKGGSGPTFPSGVHRKARTLPPSFLAEQKKQKKKQKKKKKEEKKEEKEEKKEKKKKRKAPIELD